MSFCKSAEEYYKEMTSTLTDVDISEHSFIYNALMPACYELSYQSIMLDEAAKRVFAKTALANGYYDDLKNRCFEMGIERKLATTATGTIKVTGKKDSKLPSSSLVSTSLGLTYITQSDLVINDLGIGYVNVIASAKGSKYNADIGEINSLPVKYEGIFQITNEEKFNNGYDDETYDALYERYQLKVQTPSTSGNKYHYQNWALEVDGVGSAKVYPLWDKNNGMNGNGTVKVVIANSNKRAASEELIKNVAAHIEEERPIGPIVTVVSVQELLLNINVKLVYDSTSYVLDTVKTNIINVIGEYLKEVALKTDHISIAKIGALILSTSGVTDYSNLAINGSIVNLPIGDNQISVLNEVVCNVT